MDKLPEINSTRWLSLEDLPGEEWATIPGYQNAYMVSTMGRVKCIGLCTNRVKRGVSVPYNRKPFIKVSKDNGHGYHTVSIFGDHHYVHRLVATAFIPNLFGYPEIDHINGGRSDNRACNLRWVDKKMNMANPITKERARIHNESMQKPVVQLSGLGEFIREWPSGTVAARELGVPRSVIVDVLRKSRGDCERKAKTVSGTIFLYKEDYDHGKEYGIVYKMYASEDWDVLSEKGVVELDNGIPIKYFPNTVVAARYYNTSRGAISTKIIRDKSPRKFQKPTVQKIPQSVTFLMNLESWQVEYVRSHFRDIVIRTA